MIFPQKERFAERNLLIQEHPMNHQEDTSARTEELTIAVQSVVESFQPYRTDHRRIVRISTAGSSGTIRHQNG
jgi:hypothetical protein